MRPALSLVGYEQELRPAMAYVFGSTFICDTLAIAKQVHIQFSTISRPNVTSKTSHYDHLLLLH